MESGAQTTFPGDEVMLEIGAPYVAIARSCEFWSYSPLGPEGEPGGVVYTGRLSGTQASEINELLDLNAWNELGPVHGLCCVFDSAPVSYRWGSDTVVWVGTPSSAGPPPLPDGFPVDLSRVHFELNEIFSGLGSPTSGAVRYTAILAPWLSDRHAARAPMWPLEVPISDLAVTDGEVIELQIEGLPPPVYRAEGADAERLRTLRARAQDGEFGSLEGTGFIPIRESDGSTYRLYVRDVGSFEAPEGVPARDPLSL